MAKQCLRPGCTKYSDARGLCKGCYVYARNEVISGRRTWEELERLGKVLPRKQKWARSPITQWFRGGKASHADQVTEQVTAQGVAPADEPKYWLGYDFV